MLKPSLNEMEDANYKSYDISKLFYVSFFGGVIPLIILGTKNAKWLRLKKNNIYILASIGILMILLKVIVVGLLVAKQIIVDPTYLKWGFRLLSVCLFLGYYYSMKGKFEKFILLDQEVQPILKHALGWIAVAIVVEWILLTIGGLVTIYVIR